MFALKDSAGAWVLDRNGKRFTYSSRALARLGAHHLGKARKTVLRVVEA